MNNFKKLMLSAGIAGLALTSSPSAKSAVLNNDAPVAAGTSYGLVSTATNNDAGATYDSTTFDSYATLGQDMFDLGSHSYGSVKDLMDSTFNTTISGSASSGWNPTVETDGSVSTNHIPGDPGFDYNIFNTGKNQSVITTPDYINLELNATGGHQSFTLADTQSLSWNPSNYDAIIAKSDNPLFGLSNYTGSVVQGQTGDFTGTLNFDNSWSAAAPIYRIANPNDFGVVPEPNTAAFVGLGGLALALGYRRRK